MLTLRFKYLENSHDKLIAATEADEIVARQVLGKIMLTNDELASAMDKLSAAGYGCEIYLAELTRTLEAWQIWPFENESFPECFRAELSTRIAQSKLMATISGLPSSPSVTSN